MFCSKKTSAKIYFFLVLRKEPPNNCALLKDYTVFCENSFLDRNRGFIVCRRYRNVRLYVRPNESSKLIIFRVFFFIMLVENWNLSQLNKFSA